MTEAPSKGNDTVTETPSEGEYTVTKTPSEGDYTVMERPSEGEFTKTPGGAVSLSSSSELSHNTTGWSNVPASAEEPTARAVGTENALIEKTGMKDTPLFAL